MMIVDTQIGRRPVPADRRSAASSRWGDANAPRFGRPWAAYWAGLWILSGAVAFGAALWGQGRALVGQFLAREARESRWVVFLNDNADRALVETRLQGLPGVRGLRFIGKEEALERARGLPALEEGLRLTVRNPLPASFEVVWDPAFLRPQALAAAAAQVRRLDGVVHVGYDRPRAERSALLARLSRQSGLALALLAWAAGALLCAGAARFLFWTRRPVPVEALALALGGGAGAGAVAAGAAWAWLGTFSPEALAAGAATALLGLLARLV